MTDVPGCDDFDELDAALDALYDKVNDLLLAGDFEAVDRMLQEATKEPFRVCLGIGFLTITLAAKQHLPSRPAFFKAIAKCLEERGTLPYVVLRGLE